MCPAPRRHKMVLGSHAVTRNHLGSSNIWFKLLVMRALVNALVRDFVRIASTAITIWAGTPSCLPGTPVFTCPDCICSYPLSRYQQAAGSCYHIGSFLIGVLFGIILSICKIVIFSLPSNDNFFRLFSPINSRGKTPIPIKLER